MEGGREVRMRQREKREKRVKKAGVIGREGVTTIQEKKSRPRRKRTCSGGRTRGVRRVTRGRDAMRTRSISPRKRFESG